MPYARLYVLRTSDRFRSGLATILAVFAASRCRQGKHVGMWTGISMHIWQCVCTKVYIEVRVLAHGLAKRDRSYIHWHWQTRIA